MDPRGSITKHLQSDGTTVFASREYDAFGNLIPGAATGTWPGIFGYQGQAWQEIKSADGAQRLILSPTRIYYPVDGNFLSRDSKRLTDPIRPPRLILPSYLNVDNNPAMNVDPDGKEIRSIYGPGGGTGWQAMSPMTGLGVNVVVPGVPWGQPNVVTVITNPASNVFVYQPVFGQTVLGQQGRGAGQAAINALIGAIIGLPILGCPVPPPEQDKPCRVKKWEIEYRAGQSIVTRAAASASGGQLGFFFKRVNIANEGPKDMIGLGFDFTAELHPGSDPDACNIGRYIKQDAISYYTGPPTPPVNILEGSGEDDLGGFVSRNKPFNQVIIYDSPGWKFAPGLKGFVERFYKRTDYEVIISDNKGAEARKSYTLIIDYHNSKYGLIELADIHW